ncbi:MAG: PAS domain-containing protein [Desulfuromonadaceae bacterium]|nr:PAS domain-containing protein [Desulfuromonadaceae bacterium]
MLTESSDVSPAAHEYILQAKQEWEHTFDAVTDLIFILDPDCTIIRANRAMAERCGLTPQELIGRKCFDVLHGITCPPEYCPHDRLLESGEPQTVEFETEQLHGIFEVFMSPMRNAEGRITASVHVARDVTEKRHNAKLLAAQQKQLESFNQDLESRITEAVAELRKKDDILIQQSRLTAMGDLINSIAHHWRQPLNSIGLIVQSLQLAFKSNDLSVEELDAEIADTMSILQQISDTIDDFRTFFNHEKEPHSFSVNDAVSRSINFVMPSLKNNGIKAVSDEQSDMCVVGYPNEYTQALLNIIINARDALMESQMPEPLISIRIFEEKGRSVVTVLDNGGGINEDALPRIFDPYFTTKEQGKGSGIGLYMAKMIIEKNMNGRLTARNVDGGAEFRIEV